MNWVPVLFALGVMGILGLVFGVMLTVADKKLAVETDERVTAVRACLAGANCGACGFPGCDGMADAIVAGKAPVNGCPPGGAKSAAAIAAIMGVAAEEGEAKVARVRCQGDCDAAKARYDYNGYTSCFAASALAGGPKVCAFSCIGLGDCEKACAFGAVSIANGLAHIDETKCVACGKCAHVCPRNVIALAPVSQKTMVLCQNKEPGKVARQGCTKACIACGICAKNCPSEAITVEGNVAVIDASKCTGCGVCAQKCPTKAIQDLIPEVKAEEPAEAKAAE